MEISGPIAPRSVSMFRTSNTQQLRVRRTNLYCSNCIPSEVQFSELRFLLWRRKHLFFAFHGPIHISKFFRTSILCNKMSLSRKVSDNQTWLCILHGKKKLLNQFCLSVKDAQPGQLWTTAWIKFILWFRTSMDKFHLVNIVISKKTPWCFPCNASSKICQSKLRGRFQKASKFCKIEKTMGSLPAKLRIQEHNVV